MKKVIHLRQKFLLIIFGVLSSLVILEISLRIAGLVYLSVQEYRNRLSLQKKDAYRILCLGESTTELGGQDSWPRQLDEMLNSLDVDIGFSVINKGVGGTTSSRILFNLESYLNQYKPDMVITMIGINDSDVNILRQDVFDSQSSQFWKSLRIAKLFKLLYSHISHKFLSLGSKQKNIISGPSDKNIYNNTAIEVDSAEPRIRFGARL